MKDNGTGTRNEAILYIRMYVHVHTQRVIIHVNMLCIHNMRATGSWVALFPNLSHVSKKAKIIIPSLAHIHEEGQSTRPILGHIKSTCISIILSISHFCVL